MGEDAHRWRARVGNRGYTPSPKNFDALLVGFYEGSKLLFAAKVRNGFVPARAGSCVSAVQWSTDP